MTLELAARAWLGVPWRHLGRSRAGVDCIGLVILAAADLGLRLEDPAPYARTASDARLADGVAAYGLRLAEPEPGAVLVLRSGRFGGHVGIAGRHPATGAPTLIHASADYEAVREHRLTPELRRALVGAWRLREDAEWRA